MEEPSASNHSFLLISFSRVDLGSLGLVNPPSGGFCSLVNYVGKAPDSEGSLRGEEENYSRGRAKRSVQGILYG